MYAQQQSRRWLTRRRLLQGAGIIFGTAMVLFLVYVGYHYPRTGFGQANVTEGIRPAKSLWDWLKLLGVPVVLAVAGYLFTRSERRSTQHAAEQRTQDEALQTYLDQIGLMLLDEDTPLRGIADGNDPSDLARYLARLREQEEVRNLARSRTLTVLSRLDGERKATVVRFLYESELIGRQKSMKPPIVKVDRIIDLRGADLRGANLRRAALNGANLSGADLSGADLSYALLDQVVLRGADLTGTTLRGAILIGADFSNAAPQAYNPTPIAQVDQRTNTKLEKADLRGAVLYWANIGHADFRKANLEGASVIHMRADPPPGILKAFKGWRGIEEGTNLWFAHHAGRLQGAKMPDGKKYEYWSRAPRTNKLLRELDEFLYRDE